MMRCHDKRQQTVDEAEEKGNTVGIHVRCVDDDSICVNNLIFVY